MKRRRSSRRNPIMHARAMLGFGNLGATNYLSTAAGNGTAGTAAGFFIAKVIKIVTVANSQWLGSNTSNSSANGWMFRQQAATTVWFKAANGVGTVLSSPTVTLTGYEGKMCSLVGVHDGSALRLYFNGVESGSGTAITGYTAPAASSGHSVATQQNAGSEWYGECSGHAVPSAANILSWWTACKSARRCLPMVGVTTDHLWTSIPRAVSGSVPDSLGGHAMTISGTPTLVQDSAPAWGG